LIFCSTPIDEDAIRGLHALAKAIEFDRQKDWQNAIAMYQTTLGLQQMIVLQFSEFILSSSSRY
jgi:hypothetical protein